MSVLLNFGGETTEHPSREAALNHVWEERLLHPIEGGYTITTTDGELITSDLLGGYTAEEIDGFCD